LVDRADAEGPENLEGSRLQAAAVTLDSFADGLAIRSYWASLDRSWNERDAEQFCDLFAEDASLEFVNTGPSLEGRAAIRRHFADQFPRYAPHVSHSTQVRGIREVAAGVVAVDAGVAILEHGSAGEARRVLRSFSVAAVMLRIAAGWELRWMRVFPQTVTSEPKG
jgi:uncharacterized protein (TIGR02246 family)